MAEITEKVIVSIAFNPEYGHCTYYERVTVKDSESNEVISSSRDTDTLSPDHDFVSSPVAEEVKNLCEVMWTEDRKARWEKRKEYVNMTPEERQEAGYS
jgi:hypothetical protein